MFMEVLKYTDLIFITLQKLHAYNITKLHANSKVVSQKEYLIITINIF